ncbi:MAG TPA: alcohol dehydrogenase catalytic domain-containing protein [Exilispira sp.]|nr:alcohol dehydrogenase catalytic domain-containing protein [Exilispira sp.]
MKAMVLEKIGYPLKLTEVEKPEPKDDQVLIKIVACGVCRTELDQIEGRIKPPKLPIILGHQPVGYVEEIGKDVKNFKIGDNVGATWLYSSCKKCDYCKNNLENLCSDFRATGCDENGGYAQYMVISEKFAVKIPNNFEDIREVAPLLCGGVVGYRSIRLANIKDGEKIAIWGFGSANHQVFQTIKYLYPKSPIAVFTRNKDEQDLARNLKADFVYSLDEKVDFKANKAIYTIPVWSILIKALENLEKGGKLVINLIRMQDMDKEALLKLDYAKHLWMEKQIQTVANITMQDAKEFLQIASKIPIKPNIQYYKLEQANQALTDLKEGRIKGSKVLLID